MWNVHNEPCVYDPSSPDIKDWGITSFGMGNKDWEYRFCPHLEVTYLMHQKEEWEVVTNNNNRILILFVI